MPQKKGGQRVPFSPDVHAVLKDWLARNLHLPLFSRRDLASISAGISPLHAVSEHTDKCMDTPDTATNAPDASNPPPAGAPQPRRKNATVWCGGGGGAGGCRPGGGGGGGGSGADSPLQGDEAALAAARRCLRHGRRRSALAGPLAADRIPQETRERIQDAVSARRRSVTHRLSQYLREIASAECEVDLT